MKKNKDYSLSVVICCDGMPFHGDTLKEASLGGSETAALQLAAALQKQGHVVNMFSHCEGKEGKYDGVTYRDVEGFIPYAMNIPHDICIVERAPQLFNHRFNSKLNFLWCHDLAVMRTVQAYRGSSWNVDGYFVMSEFQKQQSNKINTIPNDYYWVTKNGVDLGLINEVADQKRDPKKLMYAARPERGLDNLLYHIFPALLEKDPELKLYIAGYDNFPDEMKNYYAQLTAKANEYPNNVVWLPPQTKEQLYAHYKSASLYLYPQGFEEISCISCMESMACGLPMITRDVGALKETLHPDAGVLLSGFDSDKNPEFHNQFVETVLALLADPNKIETMGNAGKEHAKTLDWDIIAKSWTNKFYQVFDERTKSKETLANHLMFRSDIVATKKLVKEVSDEKSKKRIKQKLEAWEPNFGKIENVEKISDKGLDDYLSDIGGIETLKKITLNKVEPHWPMLDQWLSNHPDVKNILDFGCFTGRYAIPLGNNDKKYNVVAVDASQKTVDLGNNLVTDICPNKNVEFICAEYQGLHKKLKGKVDCLLMFDILEHLPNPTEAMNELEKCVKPDGHIIIITPYGPYEADSFEAWNSNRIHVSEFGKDDFKDLFKTKKNFQIGFRSGMGQSKIDRSMFGKFIITYQKSSAPTGKINYERKLKLQNPKQTISACLITKNEENCLGKCLKSIRPYVDEIIVCDTGSTDRTIEIAKQYKAKVIKGSNPLQYGFETARNESIREATGDWILWIDADEELLKGENLGKYLKQNLYNGYSIRQHHLSIEPPNAFKPDLPVRVFRNNIGMKFFGYIHEHPELGLNKGAGEVTIISDVDIAHTGYYTEPIRRKRFERNLPLLFKDRQKYPDRILGIFFEIRDRIHFCRYTLEKTGNQVSPEIAESCNEVVRLYREHFLGSNLAVSNDAINYYSDANRILQSGFECAWIAAFGKFQAKPNEKQPIHIRFASTEDAKKHFNFILESQTKSFMNKYF